MSLYSLQTPIEKKDCWGWQTPIAVFNVLDDEFCFSLDVAASQKNAFCVYCQSDCVIWCSPFYRYITALAEKTAEQCDKQKYIVLILLLSDVSTGWLSLILKKILVFTFINHGYLSFINPEIFENKVMWFLCLSCCSYVNKNKIYAVFFLHFISKSSSSIYLKFFKIPPLYLHGQLLPLCS